MLPYKTQFRSERVCINNCEEGSMKLSDDFDDRNAGLPLVSMTVGVALFVLTVVGIVVLANRSPAGSGGQGGGSPGAQTVQETQAAGEAESGSAADTALAEGEDPYISGSKLTSDDLDFWHMYDETESPEEEEQKKKEQEEKEKEQDPSTDGKHTKLVTEDGTEEWVSINPYLTKNTYDFSGLVYQYPIMKYYEDSEKVSHVGIRVSADDGDINFNRLKKAGVEFVMIQIGSRGYGSGDLMADDMFYENINKAIEAELDVGVTFFSQAVTKEEALEEAMRVIEGLQGFTIVYPVAFDMEYVKNDTARVQGLSKDEKTEIARTFMDAIEQAGYKAILYGNKEWLLRRVDLSKLISYDIWFTQEQDTPDYPYRYTMWEYTKSAKLDGLEEPGKLSICFIDYASK